MSPDQSFRNIYWVQESSWNVDSPSQNIRKYLTLCVLPEMTGTSYRYLRWFVSPDQSFKNIFLSKKGPETLIPHLRILESPWPCVDHLIWQEPVTGTWDNLYHQINHSGTFIRSKKVPEMLIPHLRILESIYSCAYHLVLGMICVTRSIIQEHFLGPRKFLKRWSPSLNIRSPERTGTSYRYLR